MAVHSDSTRIEIFVAAIAFPTHTLLFQPHSSSQMIGNMSVVSFLLFLLFLLFFFSQLFLLIIFISLPRHRHRASITVKFVAKALVKPDDWLKKIIIQPYVLDSDPGTPLFQSISFTFHTPTASFESFFALDIDATRICVKYHTDLDENFKMACMM